jgi:hypothetical protein
MSAIEWIETTKKKEQPIIDGHLFKVKERKSGGKAYWICNTKGCDVRAVTNNRNLVHINKNHSHNCESKEIITRKYANQCKNVIRKNPLKPIPQIFNEERLTFVNNDYNNREEVIATLPNYESIKSSLYRTKKENFPSQPAIRSQLIINDLWSKTIDGRDFVLADNGIDDRIIIFGTSAFLIKACSLQNSVVFMDGTFKSTPPLFKQIYTFHCFIAGQMFPIVFGLLPNKREDTYRRFLQMIKSAALRFGTDFSPEIIQIDYEIAMMNAIRGELPYTRIRGCYFHFTQAIWRKVQDLGLTIPFRDNNAVKKTVRRVSALPLVPISNIDAVWESIQENAPLNINGVESFIDYVVNTWIDEIYGLFNRTIWTHFDNNGARTNNHLEGFHYKINKCMGKIHPNIFEMITVLQKVQNQNEIELQYLLTGGKLKNPRKKYRDIHERLIRLRERLANNEIELLHFVDSCSYQLKLQS